MVQDRINKGILKFPEKKETMLVDEDPFPPVANVNAATFDLREVLNARRKQRRSEVDHSELHPERVIRKVWVPKKYLVKEERAQWYPKKEQKARAWSLPRAQPPTVFSSHRKQPRFVAPSTVKPGNQWHIVEHKKFLEKLSRTQKRRLLREKAALRRKKDLEQETEREKPKFGRKVTEDQESIGSSDDLLEVELIEGSFIVGGVHVSFSCDITSLTPPSIFRREDDSGIIG